MDFLSKYLFAPLIVFALLLIVFLIIAFVRFIVITAKIKKWREFAVPAIGIVGELKDVNCIYDDYGQSFSYRHNFVLKIICDGQEYESVYSEEVLPDQEPVTYQGQKINILWSARDHKYLQIAETKEEKRQQIKWILNDTSSRFLRAHPKRDWTK